MNPRLIGIKRVSDETPNLLTQTSLNSDIQRQDPNFLAHSKVGFNPHTQLKCFP